MRTGLVVMVWLAALSHAAAGDLAFHIAEDVDEVEVSPGHARHLTHWEGDYYVSDAGVTVSGWGRKPSEVRTEPFDTPVSGTNRWGSASTTTFHRADMSLDVTIEYETFTVRRHVVMTGPGSCSIDVSATLKPGQTLFAVRRRSNSEPMLDSRRDFVHTRCRLPALSS